jgi:hypothetical protein
MITHPKGKLGVCAGGAGGGSTVSRGAAASRTVEFDLAIPIHIGLYSIRNINGKKRSRSARLVMIGAPEERRPELAERQRSGDEGESRRGRRR